MRLAPPSRRSMEARKGIRTCESPCSTKTKSVVVNAG